jgi:hypothetical protein
LDVEFDHTTTSLEKSALDLWLTERYSLYENCNNKICRFDIHHKEWKLDALNAKIIGIRYKAGKYIPIFIPINYTLPKKWMSFCGVKKELSDFIQNSFNQ